MSIRKREWITRKGEAKTAWVVDYKDGEGVRRLKTFKKKKEADAFAATATVEIRQGTHVADGATISVAEAGKLWLKKARADGLERSTLQQYETHLRKHISPHIGGLKLSQLNTPTVRSFEDKLAEADTSRAMVSKIVRSLGSLLADAQERGFAAHNPVRELGRRRRGRNLESGREKGRLEVGVDIPTPDEIRAILAAVSDRWRPFVVAAVFTGLRASELRGLRWADVDFDKQELHIRQRADRFNEIGPPKSKAGVRDVPVPPIALNTLREWKLKCPTNELDLVFPNGAGNVESLSNVINRGLVPAQLAAGVTSGEGGGVKAKYTGLHALRHFYASWCINRKEDGGIGLPPKSVQERLGHASITMTMDTYGHLFPRGDDTKELADAEAALLA